MSVIFGSNFYIELNVWANSHSATTKQVVEYKLRMLHNISMWSYYIIVDPDIKQKYLVS